jgi:hypothetical protein
MIEPTKNQMEKQLPVPSSVIRHSSVVRRHSSIIHPPHRPKAPHIPKTSHLAYLKSPTWPMHLEGLWFILTLEGN